MSILTLGFQVGQCLITHQDKKSESTSSNKIERLYDSHEWNMKNIKTFLPIYEYFSAVRNSIAHRQSKASHKLSEISKSQELKESVERNFPKGKPLSEFEYNEDIFISPKTSLLCSHIIRLIFEDINKYIIKKWVLKVSYTCHANLHLNHHLIMKIKLLT